MFYVTSSIYLKVVKTNKLCIKINLRTNKFTLK